MQGAARRAGPLRDRPDRLAPAQRHDRRCTSSSRPRSPTGWAPRTRSSSRPATRPTSARSGTILGAGRHGDRRLRRPRLDPRRLPALAREAAPVPPQPPRPAGEAARARRATDGGGVLVVVDGVFSMEGDIAPLPEICELCERYGARLMVDEAHGAGVLGARGAGTSELLGVEDRRRPADGHVLQVAGLVRRLHRRAAPRSSSSCASSRGRSCSPPRRARGRRRRAGRAAGPALRRGPAAARARARQRPLPARRPASSAASRSSSRSAAGGGDVVTPIVPVVVGDDWKAGAAVAGALRRRRLRQHRPAPGGAARRRAAAHVRDGDPRPPDAGPRARGVRHRQGASSRPSTGRCRARRAPASSDVAWPLRLCPIVSQTSTCSEENVRSERMLLGSHLDRVCACA